MTDPVPELIAVSATGAPAEDAARQLARTLGIPLLAPDRLPARGMALVFDADGLSLRNLEPGAPGPVRVDWCGGAMGFRRRRGRDRGGALVRAVCGGARPDQVTVVDATAGLGRDGFVLAWLGCTVTLVERSPPIAALLCDGLRRARADPVVGPVIAQRLALVEMEAADYLSALAARHRPEVVYLDLMYPQRRKGALVRKEMRVVRALSGDETDAGRLLAVARDVARTRVVVKRPVWARSLPGPEPAYALRKGDTRYDVYRC